MTRKQKLLRLFWCVVGLGAFFICCFVKLSDGDDLFLQKYTAEMDLVSFLKWRYATWDGKVAECVVIYLIYRIGIWFWRIINALVLALIPYSLLELCARASGFAGYWDFLQKRKRLSVFWCFPVLAVLCYFMMDVMTVGYACIWISGSTNYAWAILCGIWVLMPVADYVFDTGKFSPKQMGYAVLCTIYATMCVEQMGAMIVAFLLLAMAHGIIRKKKIPVSFFVLFAVAVSSYAVEFLAPGNAFRIQKAIEVCMPQYESLTFGEHFFITLQWLLSSFANENALILFFLWIAAAVCLFERKRAKGWRIGAIVFAVSALLARVGVPLFCDLGLHIEDVTAVVDPVPVAADLNGMQIFAMCWWGAALIFTLLLLAVTCKGSPLVIFSYLGSIACEAILYFSPTMYASGERVYFLTDLVLWFLFLLLVMGIRKKRHFYGLLACCAIGGVLNFVFQIPVVVRYL